MTDDKIRTVRGLQICKQKHKAIRALRKQYPQPGIHGDKVWYSSYLIMDYLEVCPLPKGARVLEVGCGWGLLSIFCAKRFNARVTALDADPNVFPYLRLHAELNRARLRTRRMRYQSIPAARLRGLDLLAGGDICFWNELVNPLFRLIQRAVQQGVETIVLADPGRPPFLKLARRCRKAFRCQLLPWSITDPKRREGFLLVIYP